MATRDPHIALIDAHEKLEQIKLRIHTAIRLAQAKQGIGDLSDDDKLMIKTIQAEAIEQTKRIQDQLYKELESHG